MGTPKPNTTKARHYQYEKQEKQFPPSTTPVVTDRLTPPPKLYGSKLARSTASSQTSVPL